jgi:hypothetical protein
MVRACESFESMFRVFEVCVRGFWVCVVCMTLAWFVYVLLV